jgi:hypothetical protein
MYKSRSTIGIRSRALGYRIVKEASFRYSDGPHGKSNRAMVIGKTSPGTVTDSPRKGQKSKPTKHSNIPYELRERLRSKSSVSLARSLEKAGGPTTAAGSPYAAVLEERAVNPNLAPNNINMAKSTPNDIYYPRYGK